MRGRKPNQKNYSGGSKWTDEQIAFLVVRKAMGNTHGQIAKALNRKFGTARTEGAVTAKYKGLMNPKPVKEPKFSKEEKEFIYACVRNNFSDSRIIVGFLEQYKKTLDKSDILTTYQEMTVKERIQHENKVDKNLTNLKSKIKKNLENKIKENIKVKKMKRQLVKWTKEEDEKIGKCANAAEALKLGLNRTESAVQQRYYTVKKRNKMMKKNPLVEKKGAKRGRMTIAELQMIRDCETVEEALALNLRKPETIIRQFTTLNSKKKEVVLATGPKQKKKKKTHGNKGKKYTPRWTKEEDYDLILNFYELSIDEARNRFNRSYGAIASRLEKLVDSTEPHHIEMLMEASKEIKKRKNQRVVEKQKSRRVLRRERKEAKKLAKLQKKIAKLQG